MRFSGSEIGPGDDEPEAAIMLSLRGLPYGIYSMDTLEWITSNRLKVELLPMYEVDVNARVRELCQQIVDEQDPHRVEELIATLRSTVRAGYDEARLRMSYVARHYRGRLRDVPTCESAEQVSEGARRIRAVLNFLGLGAGMRLGREIEG
jgi:hypothetical protein